MKKLMIALVSAAMVLTGCGTARGISSSIQKKTVSEVQTAGLITQEVHDVQEVEEPEESVPVTTQTIDRALLATDKDVEDANIPTYSGQANVPVNDDIPYFTEDDLTLDPFEQYSDLDDLGRCGTAYANICTELMPTEPRDDIGMIKPSGWVQNKYPDIIDDNYLYNRCHLIGFQLAGENANEKNLITGTRYLNIEGMFGLENTVADYIHMNPENHVLYRVTPVFEGDDLLCRGILMEAMSVEDKGREVCFCRFAYNVQPGIEIDYATGENHEVSYTAEENSAEATQDQGKAENYVLNTRSMKFHRPDCTGLPSDNNRKNVYMQREDIIGQGYSPCGICNP